GDHFVIGLPELFSKDVLEGMLSLVVGQGIAGPIFTIQQNISAFCVQGRNLSQDVFHGSLQNHLDGRLSQFCSFFEGSRFNDELSSEFFQSSFLIQSQGGVLLKGLKNSLIAKQTNLVVQNQIQKLARLLVGDLNERIIREGGVEQDFFFQGERKCFLRQTVGEHILIRTLLFGNSLPGRQRDVGQ